MASLGTCTLRCELPKGNRCHSSVVPREADERDALLANLASMGGEINNEAVIHSTQAPRVWEVV